MLADSSTLSLKISVNGCVLNCQRLAVRCHTSVCFAHASMNKKKKEAQRTLGRIRIKWMNNALQWSTR